jgi:hypothetical protein
MGTHESLSNTFNQRANKCLVHSVNGRAFKRRLPLTIGDNLRLGPGLGYWRFQITRHLTKPRKPTLVEPTRIWFKEPNICFYLGKNICLRLQTIPRPWMSSTKPRGGVARLDQRPQCSSTKSRANYSVRKRCQKLYGR